MRLRVILGGAVVPLAVVVSLAVGAQSDPRAIAPRPAASPVGVIQRYLAGLATHNAPEVCATFAPQLQRFIGAWDQGRTCTTRVSSHWSSYSPGAHVTDIRIVRLGATTQDRYGNLAVRLSLWFDYSCMGDVGPLPGCHPGFQDRSNVIYLRRIDHRWLIVKPGQVFDDTDSTAPIAWYDPSTPPGDRSMVSRPAHLHGPIGPCAASGVGAVGRSQALVGSDGRRRIPFGAAPWLHVRHVDVFRAGRQFCVLMLLGAKPRVDTMYSFDVGQADGGGELSDLFTVTIDATGTVTTRLDESSANHRGTTCRVGYGMSGDRLEMVVTAEDFRADRSVLVDASSQSLQTGEPLLSHPLDGSDTAPRFEGLKLPPAVPQAGTCAAS